MSTSPQTQRHLVRTKLTADKLLLIHGPAESGPEARAKDQVIGVTPHRRLLEALGEGIVVALTEGASAQLVQAIDGAVVSPTLSRRALANKRDELEELRDQISEVEAAIEKNSEAVAAILAEELGKLERQERRLAETIALATERARAPRPHQPVEVRELLAALGEIARDGAGAQALDDLLHDLAPTEVNDLNIGFRTHLALPAPDGELVMLGPIHFTVENITRRGDRDGAMARLCMERAWPVSVVAGGVPMITASRSRQIVAAGLSREVRPVVGSKAASILGGCEAPEVLAVISRHFGLGSPNLEVAPELEKRILDVYVRGTPSGPKAWVQASSDSQVAELVIQIHREKSADVETSLSKAPYWERQGALKRSANRYVRQSCECGSEDLALIPTPEIRGLVCLNCRKDGLGLVIPESWNTAVANREYWKQLGYDLEIPPIPGVPANHLGFGPLRTRAL